AKPGRNNCGAWNNRRAASVLKVIGYTGGQIWNARQLTVARQRCMTGMTLDVHEISNALARRITSARGQAFVGRQSEMDRWQSFVASDDVAPLWFIVGPGGIGKSMLLHAFAA